MKDLVLLRSRIGPECSQGTILIAGRILHTLEDPWRDNAPGMSCVPAGEYELRPHDSAKYGRIWAMVNPELGIYHYPGDRPGGAGRFACLFAHSGNHAGHTEGCVLTGLRATHGALLESRAAVAFLKAHLPWESHRLTIKNPEPPPKCALY